jgi:O-antigen/teichoic acid export membrane protein
MSGKKSVSRNVAINAAGNFVPPVAAFITSPLLAHALGVEGRGLVSAAQAPLLLFVAAATFGLPEATTYLVARFPSLLGLITRRVVVFVILTGAVSLVALLGLRGPLSGGDARVADLLTISAVALIPTLLLAVVRAAAIGQEAWTLVAIERSTSSLLRLGAIVLLIQLDSLSVTHAVYVNAWAPITGALLYGLLLKRKGGIKPETVPSELAYGQIAKYGSFVWIGSISGVFLARLDQTLMVPLSGVYELGLYAVAVSVAEIPLLINNTVREVMFAADARSNNNARLTYAARVSGALCLLFAGTMAASILWWFPLLFGDAFRPAIALTLLLLLATVVGPPGSVAGAALAARGRPGLRSLALLGAFAVNLTLILLLVPIYGAIGAGVATLAGNLVSSNLNIFMTARLYSLRVRDFYLLRPADGRAFAGNIRSLLNK